MANDIDIDERLAALEAAVAAYIKRVSPFYDPKDV